MREAFKASPPAMTAALTLTALLIVAWLILGPLGLLTRILP
jgi:hypothetical protein